MKAQPLRFNHDVIAAILDGRKVQTRRILKPQPPESIVGWLREIGVKGKWVAVDGEATRRLAKKAKRVVCPYGEPGQSVDLCDGANVAFAQAMLVGQRLQRLHDISETDAAAEGCVGHTRRGAFLPGLPIKSVFALTWCETYGARAWAANPWVWVLEFRVQGAMPCEAVPADPRQNDLLRPPPSAPQPRAR